MIDSMWCLENPNAAADEIERLQAALKRISATKYGFQSVGERFPDLESDEYKQAVSDYWRELAQAYESTARKALADG